MKFRNCILINFVTDAQKDGQMDILITSFQCQNLQSAITSKT